MREDSGNGGAPSEPVPSSDPRASAGPSLIFVSDASAEAERLTKSLRERGYLVVDVPLSMLVNRVAVQRPALILCDVDADAALETTHRLRDVPGGSGVDLIFLGESGRTLSEMADAVIHESSGIFIRPVDTYALLRKVEALIGPPPAQIISSHPPGSRSEAPSSSPPISVPPLSPPHSHRPLITPSVPPPSTPDVLLDRRSFPPRGSNPPLSDRDRRGLNQGNVAMVEPSFVVPSSRPPASSQHPDSAMPSLPPPVPLGVSLDADSLDTSEPAIAHAGMSPDLESLLARAEQRVSQTHNGAATSTSSPPPRLSPEEEVDAVLPPDVLAALDDPLDEEGELDDESSAGSRVSQGTRTGSEGGREGTSAKEPSTNRLSAGQPAEEPQDSNDAATGALPGARSSDRPGLFGDAARTGMTGLQGPASTTGVGQDLTNARGVTTTGFVPPPPASPRNNPYVDDALRRATTPPPPRPKDSSPPEQTGLGGPPDHRDLERALESGRGAPELAPPRVPWEGQQEAPAISEGERGPATTAEPRWSPISADQAPTVPPPAPGDVDPESRLPTPPPLPVMSVQLGERPPATTRMARPLERDREPRPPSIRAEPSSLEVPEVLREGDAIRVLSHAVRARFSGALAFESDAGIRRVVLRDGDFVTAASSIHAETLLAFLVKRGSISQDVASQLGRRLPPFGRHAGAALIAHGHLRQDDLWPVLRSHAEWVLTHTASMTQGSAEVEDDVPGRLEAEPAVFGGATGAEVLVEVVRRAVSPYEAVRRLGGNKARLAPGAHPELLSECALDESEVQLVNRAQSNSVREVLDSAASDHFAPVLYALLQLGVLESLAPARHSEQPSSPEVDRLDDEAMRERVVARRRLVDEADYFTLLGLTRDATAYDIRRAYLELRREFEPNHLLTARIADLADDVQLIVEVLDEAYDVLRDDVRRERYRRAIQATPA
ncbi:MAG: hypothetical protein R3B89_06940 [Polyangiaceae bacterium]